MTPAHPYRITSEILPGERIYLETQVQIDGDMQTISRQVVMTRDAAVRDSLIRLGWTPPIKPLENCPYCGRKEGELHAEGCQLLRPLPTPDHCCQLAMWRKGMEVDPDLPFSCHGCRSEGGPS
jgi:hypothetical protein